MASELDADAGMLYRLMRALGSLELLHEDYTQLLEAAEWKYRQTWYPVSKMLGVIEGVKI